MKNKSGEAKKNGQIAAKHWCRTASLLDQVGLAGADLIYGETLNDLLADGYVVPRSADRDYSWGFFKKVKSAVVHATWKQAR